MSRSAVALAVLVALGLWLFLTPDVAHAQYRASVQGVVTDTTGAVIQDATVTVTNNETGLSRTGTTSGSGVYAIAGLAPGTYRITVTKQGFKKQTLQNVTVLAERTQSVNVQLEIGEATQTVNVTAPVAPVIDTESATIAGTITSKDVEALPILGNDPYKLLQLAPGAFGDNAVSAGGGSQNLPGNAGPGGASQGAGIFQTENQVQVTVNGARNTSNSFQIDGASVNSLAWGGAAVITPNSASVKEVRVVTSSYNAENPRAGGASIYVVSKSGTNTLHGSAFFRVARPGLNAYNRWNGPTAAPQRVTDRFNDIGGSIGGPIIRNKLFWFFSYETIRNSTTSTGSGWYQTPQYLSQIAGLNPNSIASKIAGYPGENVSYSTISQTADCAFSGITPCANIYDSSGNLLGLDIGSPLTTALGTPDPTYGQTGTPYGVGNGLDGVPDIFFVNTTNPSKGTNIQYNGRMDFQATQKDLVAFTIYWVPVTNTFYNGPARPANLWHNDRTNGAATLLWNRTFTPNFLNEARFVGSGWHWNEVTSNPQEPWGLPSSNFDGLANAGLQFMGAPGPSIFSQVTWNVRDVATWQHQNHLVKFGADIYWEQNNDSQVWNARPSFNFRNLWDFANDAPYQENGNFDPQTGVPTPVKKYIRSKTFGFFVQDDWRVRPNLTLNLGLRWDYFGPITETHGQISNAILGTGNDVLTNLRLKLGGNLYNPGKKNFGPQIGFAWTPFRDKTTFVVRGGFGIGYTKEEEAITLNGRGNPPFVAFSSLTGNQVVYAVPGDVNQFFNWPANPNTVTTFDPTTNLPVTGSVVLNIFPQNLPTPRTYRYSLETQYEFAKDWVGTLGYSGSQSRHETRQVELTWLYPQNENPTLAHVYYYPNDANGNYNALQLGVKHRFSKQFDVDVNYTWSKTIDEGSNQYFIGSYPYAVSYARGPADYDARHNLKLWGIWTPSYFSPTTLKGRLLGGWQLSGILNWHTGFPFNPVYNISNCSVVYPNSGYCNLRPAGYLGGATYNFSNSTFMQSGGYFPGTSTDYFVAPQWSSDYTIPPPPGVGRNTFRGPGYFDVDMSLQKSFRLPAMKVLGENAQFQLRADFFNIFNKLNLAGVSTNIGFGTIPGTFSPNASFGQAQNGLAGRVINLEARFSF